MELAACGGGLRHAATRRGLHRVLIIRTQSAGNGRQCCLADEAWKAITLEVLRSTLVEVIALDEIQFLLLIRRRIDVFCKQEPGKVKRQ